jgi:hypothetical protein
MIRDLVTIAVLAIAVRSALVLDWDTVSEDTEASLHAEMIEDTLNRLVGKLNGRPPWTIPTLRCSNVTPTAHCRPIHLAATSRAAKKELEFQFKSEDPSLACNGLVSRLALLRGQPSRASQLASDESPDFQKLAQSLRGVSETALRAAYEASETQFWETRGHEAAFANNQSVIGRIRRTKVDCDTLSIAVTYDATGLGLMK